MLSSDFIEFMVRYEHATSALTHVLSAVAFYFLITKTPKSGKPFARYLMLLQIFVTVVDFTFGVLLCPVLLFPAPASLCEGLICQMGFSSHIGQTVMYFSMGYVAMSVVFCFHFKYESIVRLSNYRAISKIESRLVKGTIFVIVTVPCVVYAACFALQEGAPAYMAEKFPSAVWIFSSGHATIAYDFGMNKWLSGALLGTTLFGMVAVTTICSFFISHTFKMLSSQTGSMSTKTRSMQRHLMVILVTQMMIPVTLQIGPLTFYAISLTAEVFTPEIVNMVFCIELLHASVHTIVLIGMTPSYRDTVIYWAKYARSIVTRSPAPVDPVVERTTRVTRVSQPTG